MNDRMDSVVIFPKSVLVLIEDIFIVSKKCSSLLHTIFSRILEKAGRMLIGL